MIEMEHCNKCKVTTERGCISCKDKQHQAEIKKIRDRLEKGTWTYPEDLFEEQEGK